MNFIERIIRKKIAETETDKGFKLSYPKIDVEKIIFYDERLVESESDENDADSKPMTEIALRCSFVATPEMCDRLEQSKILVVSHLENLESDNNEDGIKSIISFYVKPMFSYDLLNDLLYDMCVTFGLQTKLTVDENK